jgi:hypothetical protein
MTTMNRYSFASLLIPTSNPATIHSNVGGSIPALKFEDGPSIFYLNEAAKSVQFTVDPTARRHVVYPSGRIDTEY